MLVRQRVYALALTTALLLIPSPAASAGCATTPTAPSCRPSAPPTPRATPRPTPQPAPETPPPAIAVFITPKPATPRPATARPRPRPVSQATAQPVVEAPATTPEILEPSPSVEILVTTPVPEESPRPLAARNAGSSSPSGWAFFAVGLILGTLLGRASWGFLRRRSKQQIFG